MLYTKERTKRVKFFSWYIKFNVKLHFYKLPCKVTTFFWYIQTFAYFFGIYIPVDSIIIAATFHKIHRLSEAKVSGGNWLRSISHFFTIGYNVEILKPNNPLCIYLPFTGSWRVHIIPSLYILYDYYKITMWSLYYSAYSSVPF